MDENEMIDGNASLDEASAAETLKPGGGSGGTESKAEMLATFTSLLAQLGKEDLSDLFNRTIAQIGHEADNVPGDAATKNAASVAMKGVVKEDVDDMFSDEELSEELREKAATIFEAAVNTRINLELARIDEELEEAVASLEEQYEERLDEELGKIHESITEKLDQYMDYVVGAWMEENKLELETSLRADIAENFISGLQNLFAEHYITVPDEKIDLVAEMKAELELTKDRLNEVLDEKLVLENTLAEVSKDTILDDMSEGLVETQVEKFKLLAEGLEFTDPDTYRKKLEVVKENYFGAGKTVKSTGLIVESIDGADADLNETVIPAHMNKYYEAIKKSRK